MTAQGRANTAAIERLERFVVRSGDGTLTLAPAAARAGVAKGIVAEITAGMGEVNELIRQGKLATTPELSVYATQAMFTAQSVGSAWYWNWWGVEVHLSAYWTNKLIAAGNIVAAGAALCAATGVCNAPGAIVAAIFWLGASVIQWCSNSRGVVLVRTWGPAWCHGH